MDEMASVRTGQVVGAFLSILAGILTILVTSVIQILTIKAMAKLSKLAPEPETPLTTSYYYVKSPYYPSLNSIQYKYVDYHHHQHSHQPRKVYHQDQQFFSSYNKYHSNNYYLKPHFPATAPTHH